MWRIPQKGAFKVAPAARPPAGAAPPLHVREGGRPVGFVRRGLRGVTVRSRMQGHQRATLPASTLNSSPSPSQVHQSALNRLT